MLKEDFPVKTGLSFLMKPIRKLERQPHLPSRSLFVGAAKPG